jgi:hypothetical protein
VESLSSTLKIRRFPQNTRNYTMLTSVLRNEMENGVFWDVDATSTGRDKITYFQSPCKTNLSATSLLHLSTVALKGDYQLHAPAVLPQRKKVFPSTHW